MTTKSDIKLIALDMDGTLLTPDWEVSQANVQAIQQAMDKGVQVMLCTGRWLSFCHPYAEALGLNTYLVTVNGGEIWTSDKKLVERHLLDSDVTKEMWLIGRDRKSTRLNSSHVSISYAVFCLKKKRQRK